MTRALAFATLFWIFLPAAAWPVTFSPAPARVGEVEKVTTHYEFDGSMEVSSEGQVVLTLPFAASNDERAESEVLAAGDTLPTKIRVRYLTTEETARFGEESRHKKAPVAGKSYLVEKRDGKVTVTREDGGTLEAEEEKELASHADSLEHPDRDCDGLVGKDWKVGDKADLENPGIASILQMSDEDELELFQLTLKEIRAAGKGTGQDANAANAATAAKAAQGGAQLAVFGLTLRFRTQEFEGGEMTMPLSGELVVEAPSCRVLSFDATGVIEVTMKSETEEGQKLEMKGKGGVKVTMRGEYLP